MPILDLFEDAIQYHRGGTSLDSMFAVGRSIAQGVNSGVITPVQWNSEIYDLLNEVLVVNPWTFTPARTGYYYFYSSIRIIGLNAGDLFETWFRVGGVIDINYRQSTATAAGQDVSLNIAGIKHLDPTDSVDVVVRHSFGAIRTVGGNLYEHSWMGYRIR